MKDPTEATQEARDIIQFALVIIIFFSGLVYSASKVAGATDIQAIDISLIWGIGVAFHIVNYFFVEIVAGHMGTNWLRWVTHSLVAGVLAFIYPIIIVAASSNAHLGFVGANLFYASFYIAFFMPVVTFSLMIVATYWSMIREIIQRIKDFRATFRARKHHASATDN